jgi:hypothetical protein
MYEFLKMSKIGLELVEKWGKFLHDFSFVNVGKMLHLLF